MTARINITCDCGMVHDVRRTSEIPASVISLGCNWCPKCEDKAREEYEEWYNYNEGGEPIIPVPDNQLTMPFIFDELEIPKVKELITA